MFTTSGWWLSSGLCYLRVLADLSFVASFPVLWLRIYREGYDNISIETQLLQLLALACRYLDLFVMSISIYNTTLKAYFLLSATITVALLVYHRRTTSLNRATCLRLVAPCVLLATVFNYRFSALEVAWSFSQFMHALAFVPQFRELARVADTEDVDNGMVAYLLLVFAWRALYLPHWVLRVLDWGLFDPLATFTTVVQTCVFLQGGYVVVARAARRRNADVEKRMPLIQDAKFTVERKLDFNKPAAAPVNKPAAAPVSDRKRNAMDALQYLGMLKAELDGETYTRFIGIMSAFEDKSLTTPDVIDAVCKLFAAHPRFLAGFSTFLPSGYSLLVIGNTVRVSTPEGFLVRQLIAA